MERFFVVLCIVYLLWFVIRANNKVNKLTRELQEANKKIEAITKTCDAQAEHFTNCSWILKDDVGIGYDSYFYSKYHRDKKREN